MYDPVQALNLFDFEEIVDVLAQQKVQIPSHMPLRVRRNLSTLYIGSALGVRSKTYERNRILGQHPGVLNY